MTDNNMESNGAVYIPTETIPVDQALIKLQKENAELKEKYEALELNTETRIKGCNDEIYRLKAQIEKLHKCSRCMSNGKDLNEMPCKNCMKDGVYTNWH